MVQDVSDLKQKSTEQSVIYSAIDQWHRRLHWAGEADFECWRAKISQDVVKVIKYVKCNCEIRPLFFQLSLVFWHSVFTR